ncbi:MAG: peroxiredoxin [Gemmatimonadetes bacterium]|nr:peroxiredoxin [Gemmatimonadota bacterium]
MAIRLGDTAPDFRAETTEGQVSFHDWLGESWGILFSHPADFTPVCTTELGTVSKLRDEFAARGVKVIAVSVDPIGSHNEWIADINETQNTEMNYPIIADPDRIVADAYDMIHPNADDTLTVRSVFVIDPAKKVRLTLTYPAATGRNFDEILRVVDSLQLTTNFQVATPANWRNGDDCIISNTVADDELAAKFPKGYETIKPYLRTTPQPNR